MFRRQAKARIEENNKHEQVPKAFKYETIEYMELIRHRLLLERP